MKKVPQLFGYTIDNIDNKIKNLRALQIYDFIFKDPTILIPSKEVIKARYGFLRSMLYNTTSYDFTMNNPSFEKKYKISKPELLKKYNKE